MRGSIILAAMLVGLALHAGPSAAAASEQQAGKTQPAERSDRQRSSTGTGSHTSSSASSSTSTTENSTRSSSSSSSTARDKHSDSNKGYTDRDSDSDKDEPRPQPFEPAASQTPGTAQPVFVISCNASGCNDNQGNFLTRSGPQRLEGPKGISCQLMGGNWQCNPGTQP